jgi:hypothetical protein
MPACHRYDFTSRSAGPDTLGISGIFCSVKGISSPIRTAISDDCLAVVATKCCTSIGYQYDRLTIWKGAENFGGGLSHMIGHNVAPQFPVEWEYQIAALAPDQVPVAVGRESADSNNRPNWSAPTVETQYTAIYNPATLESLKPV